MRTEVNYCTSCGGKLTDEEAETAREMVNNGIPALCEECLMEAVYGVAAPIAKFYAEIGRSIAEAFESLADLQVMVEKREGDCDE